MSINIKFKRICNIFISAFLILFLVISALPVNAADNNLKKKTTTHDIAIVFDNSGSMYNNTDRWSQALYAIGVFASMLDYDAGDKLGIYPMDSISIGKSGKAVSDRLEITKENINDISKIYCAHTSDTILKPAYTAREYLKNSEANERWMIVLTDGEFFYDKSDKEKRTQKSAEWLNKKMLGFTGDNVKIQYLGFGEASKLQSNVSNNFYATNAGSADKLTGELVNICNKIFQRHKVENISNGEFTIDVSMNNIVAFVQGKGAEIKSLQTADGKSVESSLNEKLHSGTEGTGSDYNYKYADISGQVVSFNQCEAGSYKLNYTGSDVQVFYEPNVVIKSSLKDKDGNEVDTSKTVTPGEYTVDFGLYDAVNGKDVSDSKLLAPVRFEASVTNNGNKSDITSGQSITLEPDSNTHLDISATFLDEYEITNDGDSTSGEFSVDYPEADVLEVNIQGDSKLVSTDKESWKPFKVEVTNNGEKLTDDELSKLNTDFGFSDGSVFTSKPLKGESAFEVYYAQNEDGTVCDVEDGNYTFSAKVDKTDEYGRKIESEVKTKDFEVTWVPAWLSTVITLGIILALLSLIVFILTRKVLPKGVSMNIQNSHITVGGREDPTIPDSPSYSRRGIFKNHGSLGIHMPGVPIGSNVVDSCSATFQIKAVDRIYKKSKNRRIEIVSVNTECDYITINGVKYERNNAGKFVFQKNTFIENSQIDIGKSVALGKNRKKTLELHYIIKRK